MAMTFGLAAVVSPAIGMVVTGVLVHRAFSKLELPAKDPGAVSAPMGEVLIPAFIGLGVAMVALAVCVACIFRALRERRKFQSQILP